jgi:phi13 family phage major tail protein
MNGVIIGLKDVYYALLQSDPVTGSPIYSSPVKVAGAMKATVNPNASLETLFADDGPFETAASIGQISLELGVADVNLETQAIWFGHSRVGGVTIRKSSDIPPWLAIGFRTLKSNGKYRYTWLAKGKFTLAEQSNETKGDKVNFNTPTIQGSFVKRDCDDEWERHIDEDDSDYVSSLGTGWFTSPVGAVDTTPPTT